MSNEQEISQVNTEDERGDKLTGRALLDQIKRDKKGKPELPKLTQHKTMLDKDLKIRADPKGKDDENSNTPKF